MWKNYLKTKKKGPKIYCISRVVMLKSTLLGYFDPLKSDMQGVSAQKLLCIFDVRGFFFVFFSNLSSSCMVCIHNSVFTGLKKE